MTYRGLFSLITKGGGGSHSRAVKLIAKIVTLLIHLGAGLYHPTSNRRKQEVAKADDVECLSLYQLAKAQLDTWVCLSACNLPSGY